MQLEDGDCFVAFSDHLDYEDGSVYFRAESLKGSSFRVNANDVDDRYDWFTPEDDLEKDASGYFWRVIAGNLIYLTIAVALQRVAIEIDEILPFDLKRINPTFAQWHKNFFYRADMSLQDQNDKRIYRSDHFSLG